MATVISIKYVAPPFEEVQHVPTKVDANGVVHEVSLHSDVSLLLRIDSMRIDATTSDKLLEQLRPLASIPFTPEVEALCSKLSDSELIDAHCLSRYTQTQSERQDVIQKFFSEDKANREKLFKQQQEESAKAKLKADEEAFRNKLQQLFT